MKADPLPADRHHLVEGCLGLARWATRRYSTLAPSLDQEERYSACLEGLVLAARTFDFQRGVKFTTHAPNWMRRALRMAEAQSNLIHIPKHIDANTYPDTPKRKECLDAAAKVRSSGVVRIDASDTRHAYLPARPERDGADEDTKQLLAAVGRLPESLRLPLEMYYGIGCEPMSFRRIARLIGLWGGDAARQKIDLAIRTLRDELTKHERETI